MDQRFELIGGHGDTSGHLRLTFGFGPNDPLPFVITLTAQYVARAIGKTPGYVRRDREIRVRPRRGSPRYGVAGKRHGMIEPYSRMTPWS
jgi:hypothetical protein